MPASVAVQPDHAPADEAAPASAIELAALSRAYGEVPVLREVSCALPAGQSMVVLGPNGAGKTTLLRVLATLLRPSSGQARVLGCELPRLAWRARGRIGYLGHDPLLYRDLTVAEALNFHARLHRVERSAERVAELLDAVGLPRRGNELVRNLSAGQRQRVAVCRAVLHRPELLLLDEPGSHLDPHGRATVEPLIGRGTGVARVLVTHEVEAGLAEADRALALRADGTVAYEGPANGLSAGDARAIYSGSG